MRGSLHRSLLRLTSCTARSCARTSQVWLEVHSARALLHSIRFTTQAEWLPPVPPEKMTGLGQFCRSQGARFWHRLTAPRIVGLGPRVGRLFDEMRRDSMGLA